MVVAVITVLVVQTAVDDVVNVITVRYGFVAATFAVNVAVARCQPDGSRQGWFH